MLTLGPKRNLCDINYCGAWVKNYKQIIIKIHLQSLSIASSESLNNMSERSLSGKG